MATPTGLSFPSSHTTSSFAAARAFGGLVPGRAAADRGRRDGAQPPLSRRALPVRRRRRHGARPRDREPRADDEGRPRRDAQRGQVLAVQRAQPGGRGGGELPVHHDRAERRGRRRSTTSGWSRWPRPSSASNIVWDTIEFHDIAGLVAGASKGEGLGNKFLANIRECDALLHVVRTHSDDNVIHPDGKVDPARGHRDDRDRAAARRPRHRRAPPRQGRPRGPLRRPRGRSPRRHSCAR